MRHFDAWFLRDPYSIFHYYPTNRRWSENIRELIQERQICAPVPSASGFTPSTPDIFLKIDPQLNSPLFNRLPPEIRSIIWSHVFGEPVLHLVQIRNQIRHVRCPNSVSAIDRNRRCCPVTAARWRTDVDTSSAASPTDSNSTNKQHPNTDPNSKLYPHTHPSLPSHLSTTPASLLRTCRAIYDEAAPQLYRQATFDVDDLSTWIAFTDQVNPTCLQEVRKLSVQVVPLGGIFHDRETSHSHNHIDSNSNSNSNSNNNNPPPPPPTETARAPTITRPPHSIHTYTHNPHLWTSFWQRTTTQCPHLTDLTLCIDLGRFTATAAPTATNPAAGSITGGYKLPLHAGVNAEWLRPIVQRVRGLKRFELAVTARCDAAARAGVEREVGGVERLGRLRAEIRGWVCSGRCTGFEEGQDDAAAAAAAEYGDDYGYGFRAGKEGWQRRKRRLAICSA
ncbi:uncharacterized protein BO72DRAFT_451234 [Aspergillus fijiensis CBS 313.89]|uniref:DUF7730 domain-containing protein n=1 Tax=Aspergillus fijiensis CBS 313.89 TaxID=1448319 RepID=A0A8G1VYD3_9EURO|nr:uncharacterized protein BO72DRAFT_451234 [Aspergillus fijiensis CBS 313.89]RAK73909.1 hypothetical protein BO72DRAFT_451234 [Aspergillus fijiensis CBS 313.89]